MHAASHNTSSYADQPTGAWYTLFPQRLVMSKANVHELPESFKVRSTAFHLVDRFQMDPHSCVAHLTLFPRIHYFRFSVISRSRELQNTHVFLT